MEAKKGYLIFIRGSRNTIATINTTTGYTDTVILRAKGTVSQGNQTFALSGASGDFALVTNPFPAPINWANVYTTNSVGFNNFVTIWDPNQGTRGGYVTITNGGIKSTSSTLTTSLQSGQAFFVQLNAPSPTLTVNEAHKTTTNNLDVYRTTTNQQRFSIHLKYTAGGITRNADGVTALIDNSYSNSVDGNDAEQIQNWDEDVALLRGGKELSIESRSTSNISDTLFLQMLRLRAAQSSYRWEIEPFNIASITEAWLLDNFTNTSTQLSLTSKTTINFTVTSNIASQASNRFSIVFKNNAALPVTISNVKAYTKNSGVQVEWQTNNEINIESYEVEKSSNAINFATLNSQQATGSNQYQSFDANPITGNNFYRIKVIEKSGKTSYTQIVKVTIGQTKSAITIYPNPVTNNQVGLQLNQIAKGSYQVRIINKAGQTVFTKTIEHTGGTASHQLQLNNSTLSSGVYQLLVEGEGVQFTQTLLKQ